MWKLLISVQFFEKRVEVSLNMIFKVIDISMETIYQKMNFLWARSVIDSEMLKPISEVTMKLAREICKNEKILHV